MNFHNDTIRITNEDNMLLMARYPDKYFELAIIDPPYGIDFNGWGQRKGNNADWRDLPKKEWDKEIPSQAFFDELFRVSKNQIVWGANYFTRYLKENRGWIIWYKVPYKFTLSQAELAWSSFDCVVRVFERMTNLDRGFFGKNIHPTQKPVVLYKWLLSNYAKAGDKILDTHLGSGSIAIACADLGFDLTACELDTDYFNAATKRLQTHLNQAQLFQPAEVRKLKSDNTPELFF